MAGGKKDGLRQGRATKRNAARIFLPLILTLILLIPAQDIHARAQLTSGSTAPEGNTLQYGTTSYTVYYSYPSAVDVGSNLTILLTLHLNAFTGAYEYIINYNLIATLFFGSNVLMGGIASPQGAPHLYPGANWGPENITIPLTPANTGLAEGQSVNASVSIRSEDWVYYGGVAFGYFTEPPVQWSAGSLLLQNPASNSTTTSSSSGPTTTSAQGYLPYALVAAGVVLMALAVVLPRGPRPPQANRA